MFEIELVNKDEISITTRKTTININVAQYVILAKLAVGKIRGPGEFEIGDASIVGIAVGRAVIYRVEIGKVVIGVAGEVEDGLDELGSVDILGTSSVKAAGEVRPKIVIPMGNMDYAELKAEVIVEKRLKVKSESSLPDVLTVYKLD
jgi:hypothetical protein